MRFDKKYYTLLKWVYMNDDKRLKHFKKIFGSDSKITPEYKLDLKKKVTQDKEKYGINYDQYKNHILYEILDNKETIFYINKKIKQLKYKRHYVEYEI